MLRSTIVSASPPMSTYSPETPFKATRLLELERKGRLARQMALERCSEPPSSHRRKLPNWRLADGS